MTLSQFLAKYHPNSAYYTESQISAAVAQYYSQSEPFPFDLSNLDLNIDYGLGGLFTLETIQIPTTDNFWSGATNVVLSGDESFKQSVVNSDILKYMSGDDSVLPVFVKAPENLANVQKIDFYKTKIKVLERWAFAATFVAQELATKSSQETNTKLLASITNAGLTTTAAIAATTGAVIVGSVVSVIGWLVGAVAILDASLPAGNQTLDYQNNRFSILTNTINSQYKQYNDLITSLQTPERNAKNEDPTTTKNYTFWVLGILLFFFLARKKIKKMF